MRGLLFITIFLTIFDKGFFKIDEEIRDLYTAVYFSNEYYVGEQSTFALSTNSTYLFDEQDIDQQFFETNIRDEQNVTLKIKCNFWRQNRKSNLITICNLQEKQKFFNVRKNVRIDKCSFIYKDTIRINVINKANIQLYFVDFKYPFYYTDSQKIDLEDGKDQYDLKFKVGSYYENQIFIYGTDMAYLRYIKIDNCSVEQNEMTCKITKEKLESFGWIFTDTSNGNYNFQSFALEYEAKLHPFVGPVAINYKNKEQKIDVYINITKLLTNISEMFDFIAYETNVTNISEIDSKYFVLNFTDITQERQGRKRCQLKKHNDNFSLMILCYIDLNPDKKSFLNKMELFNLSDIDLNYNFILSYSNNNEIISTQEPGGIIDLIYPEILNYTLFDTLNFTYEGTIVFTNNITLNPNSSSLLKCETNQFTTRCIVPESHFEGEESGYYYIHHTNHMGGKTRFYECPPIMVILKDKDNKTDESDSDQSDSDSDQSDSDSDQSDSDSDQSDSDSDQSDSDSDQSDSDTDNTDEKGFSSNNKININLIILLVVLLI